MLEKPNGIHLTQDEADELASVAMATAQLGVGQNRHVTFDPTQEERDEAYALRDHLVDNSPLDGSDLVLTADRFPTVRKVAETALQNVGPVMLGLSTSSISGDFHPEHRGTALRALALTADLSELVRRLLPPIERE